MTETTAYNKEQIEEKYKYILHKTIDLNNQILKMITNDKALSLQYREKLFELMKKNTLLSSELATHKKQSMFHIVNNEDNDKHVQLKNFIAPLKLKVESNTYYDTISTGIQNFWYKVKVGSVLTLNNIKSFDLESFIENIKNQVETTQENVKINYDKYETKYNQFLSKISFVGEKLEIMKIEKKFKEELDFLGVRFQADKITIEENFQDFNDRVKNKIKDKFGISDIGEKTLIISGVENLDDKMKHNFYDKIFFPKLQNEIGKKMDFIAKVGNIIKKNHYLKMLNEFAETNGLEAAVAKNLLEENPNLLSQTKGYSKVIKYKEQILANYSQNEQLVKINIDMIKNYLEITDIMKSQISNLNISEESKKEFFDRFEKEPIYVLQKSKKSSQNINYYTLADIEKNINAAKKQMKKK